jgi:small subunit ribosomal protein S9
MADEPTEHPHEQPPSEGAQLEPTEPTAETSPAAEHTPGEPANDNAPGEAANDETAGEPASDDTPGEAVSDETAGEPANDDTPGEPVSDAAGEVANDDTPGEPVNDDIAAEAANDDPAEAANETSEPPSAPAEPVADGGEAEVEEEPAPRVKPSVPGAHLEVDIVPEGVDPLAPEQPADPYAIEDEDDAKPEEDGESGQLSEPIASAAIDLAAGARYKATGKRKTAIARVILRPGSGSYLINGRALDDHFPRVTLQRNIRQPLETVGYQDRMDVVARLHGGGISAQAGALRHGISRALLEADPNLRGELKRRGFLTRDSRAKERKKAGLKKARKRPQFSKR